MNFRKRIDATDGVWHFSPKCQLWPQDDYRESNEPPSLAFEHLCAECLKLEPGVSEEETKRSIRLNAEWRNDLNPKIPRISKVVVKSL